MNEMVYQEVKSIIQFSPVWCMLAIQDIRLRYRRSSLGPLWLTISMAITIYTIGFLYSHLFNVNMEHYFPYFASGIIGWTFISTTILESINAFIEAEGYIKNNENLFSSFIMRIIVRNIIVFTHNILAYIPLIFIYKQQLNIHFFMVIPGLMIICINAFFFGSVIAIIGTRYRDFHQMMNSLIQVVFFLTPIMWMPHLLPEKHRWIISCNPFNQFLNLIRNPLINEPISIETLVMISAVSLSGFFLYGRFISRYRYKVIFWL